MSLMPQYDDSPRFLEQRDVIERWVKNENPTAIARDMGIRRVDVLAHIDEWRKSNVGMDFMKGRVEDLIASMDEHYSLLIKKAYEVIDEVDELRKSDKETMTRSQMLSQKRAALDLIAKLEKDRISVLQQSGMLDAADVGDQLAEMEEKYENVMRLLEEHLCNDCTTKVLGALSNEFSGNVVVVHDGH